jgi:hypothetical protein
MNIRKLYKKNVLAIGVLALVASMPSAAVLIDFTGGTYTQNNGGTGVTSNSTSFQNVANYIEDGFKFEFFSAPLHLPTLHQLSGTIIIRAMTFCIGIGRKALLVK